MTRNDYIAILKETASEMARRHGYTEMTIGEDRQKGLWGETFTECLEKKYGECATTIVWTNPDKGKANVEFRFRFSNPVVSIRFLYNNREVLASCEFTDEAYELSDEVYEEDETYHKKGERKWKSRTIPMEITQVQLFYPSIAKGYMEEIESIWKEKLSNWKEI